MTAHNPYIPPTAAIPATRQPNRLWWIYFVLRALFALAGMVVFSLTSAPLLFASTALDAVCVVGLYFYIRSKPFIGPGFWQALFVLYLVKVVANETLNIRKIIEFQYVDWLAMGLEAVTTIPLAIALWLYAFKSPHVWRSPSAG